MSMVYNLGSIILGLGAWFFGFLAIKRKTAKFSYTFSICSFGMCVISLLFQLLEVENRVQMHDFAAIDDTIHAVIMAAVVLTIVTFVLNFLAWMRIRK